jgi:hypothetical protein
MIAAPVDWKSVRFLPPHGSGCEQNISIRQLKHFTIVHVPTGIGDGRNLLPGSAMIFALKNDEDVSSLGIQEIPAVAWDICRKHEQPCAVRDSNGARIVIAEDTRMKLPGVKSSILVGRRIVRDYRWPPKNVIRTLRVDHMSLKQCDGYKT